MELEFYCNNCQKLVEGEGRLDAQGLYEVCEHCDWRLIFSADDARNMGLVKGPRGEKSAAGRVEVTVVRPVQPGLGFPIQPKPAVSDNTTSICPQ